MEWPREAVVEEEEEEVVGEQSLGPVISVPDVAKVCTLLRRLWELAV
jgi:hypothetical protein